MSVTGGTAPYSYSWNGGATTEDRTGLIAGTYNVTVTDNKGCTITHSATITEPTAFASNASIGGVSCHGGGNSNIDISVTGGTSPYTYLWDGTITTEDRTNLIAGTYTLVVTDNNSCVFRDTFVITEPTALQTSSTATSVSCNAGSNGAIDLSVTGGTSPYSYSWNGGATTEDRTGLIAGTYNVTVTDNKGCTITHSATITEPTALQTSSTATSVSCNAGSNGAIDLSVTGGTAPYSYSWNGGATTEDRTGLIAGTYNVTVTDNKGCTITHSATITEPTALQTSSTATSVSCNAGSNGAIDLSVTGGTAPYSYSWNGGATTEDRTGLIAGTYNVTVTDNKGCTITHSATITEPTALQTSSTATSVSCNAGSNGAIDLSVTGGTAPYSYSWNGGATTEDRTGLIAGTYNVTVTDNKGCTITHSATITEPTALQTSSTATSVSCNAGSNGAIDLSVTGGTAPPSYSWNGGATTEDRTGLIAGTYNVTVTDNKGCTITHSATITEPTALQTSSTATSVSCNAGSNGAIDLSVTGGTSPYSYSWNGGASTEDRTGLIAGTYNVTVTDNKGCTITHSATITEPTALQTSSTATSVSCNAGSNGAIDLSVTGGTSPYSYSWNGGASTEDRTGLIAGTYNVTVTDNKGCTITHSATITEPTALQTSSTATSVSCNAGSNGAIDLSVTGGTAPYSYSWNGGASTEDRTGLIAGTYNVTVTDNKGCTITHSATITEPTALQIGNTVTPVKCYKESNGALTTSVIGGTSSYTYQWSNSSTQSGISGLPTGTYTLTVIDANQCTAFSSAFVPQPDSLQIQAITTNARCFTELNASVVLTATGGNVPYSYLWSNASVNKDLTGVGAGSYSVKVTDSKGCFVNGSYVLTQPAQLSNTLTKKDLRCNQIPEGEIYTNTNGGTVPYSYLWNNSATDVNPIGLFAGQYVVTVTDGNGCFVKDSITLIEPAAIKIDYATGNVLCYGGADGKITASVSGGIAPYTLLWSTGQNTPTILGLSKGVYTLTVTDKNNCVLSKSEAVTQPDSITVNVKIRPISCSGRTDGYFVVTPIGGTAPYVITWSNGVITDTVKNLGVGTYQVTVTDKNNCYKVTSIVVDSIPPIVLSGVAKNVTCWPLVDGAITLNVQGGQPLYSYSWSNGKNDQNLTGLQVGQYRVTVTDENKCTADISFTLENDSAFAIQTIDAVTIEMGDVVTLNTTSNSPGSASFNWTPMEEYAGVSCIDCQSPSAMPSITTHYNVVAEDFRGCISKDSVTIFVIPNRPLYTPNAFSPNGDGVNDEYEIFGKKTAMKKLEIMIFNRWGEKIFESNDKDFKWDGSFKGEIQTPGVYTYTINVTYIDGYFTNVKGSITLIR